MVCSLGCSVTYYVYAGSHPLFPLLSIFLIRGMHHCMSAAVNLLMSVKALFLTGAVLVCSLFDRASNFVFSCIFYAYMVFCMTGNMS